MRGDDAAMSSTREIRVAALFLTAAPGSDYYRLPHTV